MKMAVADTNALAREELAAFLARRPTNTVALSTEVIAEVLRNGSIPQARLSFALVEKHLGQVIVLRPNRWFEGTDFYALDPKVAIIDARATETIRNVIKDLFRDPPPLKLMEWVLERRRRAIHAFENLWLTHGHMERVFQQFDQLAPAALVKNVRAERPLSRKSQIWLLDLILALSANALQRTTGRRGWLPIRPVDALRLYEFRYSAHMIGLYMRWLIDGATEPRNRKRVLNDFVDARIAAQATYTGRLFSFDSGMLKTVELIWPLLNGLENA